MTLGIQIPKKDPNKLLYHVTFITNNKNDSPNSDNFFDIKRNIRKVFYKICHFDQSILIS